MSAPPWSKRRPPVPGPALRIPPSGRTPSPVADRQPRDYGAFWSRVRGYAKWVLLFLFLLPSLPGCSAGSDTWDRVQREGVLRVGLDPTYPPFEDASGGALEGMDVDLARALGREMGVEVEFVHFGYDGLYDALLTGRVDLLLSALVVQPERTRDFAYSEPYFNAGQILIVPAQSDIEELRNLGGKRVAVELGATGHVEATRWQRRVANLTIETHHTPTAALEAVAGGAADAALVDSISGRQFLAGAAALRRLPEPVTVEPYAGVVRAEDRALLAEVNRALETVQEDGTLDEIQRRWLDG